ncbi:MAG: adenylosuccinate synthase [Candidatus Gastranaerophilales bacterium]|nr:adenylosuccinate synthase [Candidatus Gastranaerophilales bacterium]
MLLKHVDLVYTLQVREHEDLNVKNTVVVGAQWGDEGKAKITDLLAQDADVIIRYQGGCNAGHTVVANNETFKFHLIPSGILYKNKFCMIGAGTVIHPETFLAEIEDLKSKNIDVSELKVSPLASITMPYHIDIDGISEQKSGENKIGTTKKGIGPTYSDKIGRYGLKIQDLYDKEALDKRLDAILPLKNKMLEKVFGSKTYTKSEILDYCKKYAEIFRPYVCDNWVSVLTDAIKSQKKILFEGAQGVMLDIDYGTYPYVTSSNPIGGGAATGSGVGPTHIKNVIGVTKAYITRVGEGPFLTELLDKTGDEIREIGHEFGTTTGRPRRCGWFDAVLSKYTVLVGGLTSMAITKLDVFDGFDELKVCVAYKDKRDGKIYEDYPTNINLHKYLEPVYETHKGWKSDISKAKSMEELPENAKKYLSRLEDLVGIPINIVSVGPDRDQTIILNHPFK